MQESEKRFELSSPGYGSTKRPPLPNILSQISRLHFESTRVRLICSSNSAKQQIIQAQVYFSVPCRNISSSHARFKILVFVSQSFPIQIANKRWNELGLGLEGPSLNKRLSL